MESLDRALGEFDALNLDHLTEPHDVSSTVRIQVALKGAEFRRAASVLPQSAIWTWRVSPSGSLIRI